MQARDWLRSFRLPLRTLDALHLSVAATDRIPIATADGTLADSGKQLGMKVHLIGGEAG